MADGKKFNHIVQEGFLQTSSGDFENLTTATLSGSIGKMLYAKAWVLGNDGAGGLYIKRISQVGLGTGLIVIPGTEISDSANTTGVTPDAQIVSHGGVVKLQVNADFADIGFYGRLEIHGILKDING